MSAIDWLSESVTAPVIMTPNEEAVANTAAIESITVQPLDATPPDAVGILSPAVTGLPMDLWGRGGSDAIVSAVLDSPVETLPATAALRQRVLLAEADAPVASDGSVLLARVDKLLDIGALDDAQALLDQAGPTTPDLFRRWFDVALLTGTEDRACEALRSNSDIAPTYQARIFCLARNGDWDAAALTLNSAASLGVVDQSEYDLISRFLDPELFEGEPPLPVPDRPTPLVFRMFEAIGEPLPTQTLPRAFAHADLRSTAGWKARIEAGERLARVGAISDNRLLGIYSERSPAASGGVWDRVDALQKFDDAIRGGDADAVAETFPKAWREMARAGLSRVFACLYAPQLSQMELDGSAADLAFRAALLSDDYEVAARNRGAKTPEDRFLVALAQGRPTTALATTDRAQAVRDGFDGGEPSAEFANLMNEDRLGEAILTAVDRFTQGAEGDLEQITRALRFFRSVGLEDTARQASLQFLLMSGRS